MTKAVVLLSGGLDSTTCLAMAVNKHSAANVAALTVFYGQRHAKELEAARNVVDFYKVKHYELDAAEVFRHSNSALLETSNETLEQSSYAEQMKKNHSPKVATYVPFRNGLMLSMAASFADGLYDDDLVELYIGVHDDDAAGSAYADCRADFVAAMSAAIRIGTYEKIHIVAPFLCQKKSDVVKVGLSIGAPYHLTWSCYERGEVPCGHCATCIDRAQAFAVNGVKDPALVDLRRKKFLSLVE
ncbi:MAG: 7-cyano-7-deazaguanine synthase QueC [Selenomonadaceae bacterium]|nr:7-cyano-7-deazaguanine synthase QueC [Selenomonadaceae bacterium]